MILWVAFWFSTKSRAYVSVLVSTDVGENALDYCLSLCFVYEMPALEVCGLNLWSDRDISPSQGYWLQRALWHWSRRNLPALKCKVCRKWEGNWGWEQGDEKIRSLLDLCLSCYVLEGIWVSHCLPREVSLPPIPTHFPLTQNRRWTGVSTPGLNLEKRQLKSVCK